MRPVDIIRKKRDGGKLTPEEINFMIDGYVKDEIPDYQMSALLMAIYFQNMDFEETQVLTEAMIRSGETVNLSHISGPKVDKHSTGGVGDKISLILGPLVASVGVVVPMISGRALGHTGGTLDKLDSIPGYRTSIPVEEFVEILSEVGISIIGQTEELVPADRKLYALRDVTATVESIPLITSSIMSKKIAEGIDGLVLDVKTGSGAFMRKIEDARRLAKSMVETGKLMGKKVVALITNMDQPLGEAVGNAVEVVESVKVLKNEGPRDVRELSIALGVEMLLIGGIARSRDEARKMLEDALEDGRAYEKWRQMVFAHGGDPDAVEKEDFVKVKGTYLVKAGKSGYLAKFDTLKVGLGATVLGAGRSKKEDEIDHNVGIMVLKKVGDQVSENDVIFEVLYNDESKLQECLGYLESSFSISDSKPNLPELIFERIE